MGHSRTRSRITVARIGLLGSLLGALTACERLEPQVESSVVFQAAGRFEIGSVERNSVGAALVVRDPGRADGRLAVEIQGARGEGAIAGGFLPAEAAWLADRRGPLEMRTEDANGDGRPDAIQVQQRVQVSLPVSQSGIVFPHSGRVASASFERLETRSLSFSAGLLKTGSQGQLALVWKDRDGQEIGRFQGQTTTPTRRVAVGTQMDGSLSESWSFGASQRALLTLDLPLGVGSFVSKDVWGDDWRQAFRFDPARDLSELRGEVRVIAADASRVAFTDQLSAAVAVNRVEIDQDRTASARGSLHYDVTVQVTQNQVTFSGSSSSRLELSPDLGPAVTFTGRKSILPRTLTW